MITVTDLQRLREALALAEGAVGLSEPNPRVGCIVADANGLVLGSGHTQRAGEAHAEAAALAAASLTGRDLRGGTAWVTLEPCSHHGRTPPCADALVAAGVARVVVAVADPNPLVDGGGVARLRAAGIQVDMAPPELAANAIELNIGFFSRMRRQRPWVRLKSAVSIDGRTALADGSSRWITGDAARADGHAWRRRAGAVLSGSGTLRTDDPRLDVRLVPTALQPLRLIALGRQAELPLDAATWKPPGHACVVAASLPPATAAALRARGVEVLELPGPDGRVDLKALLIELAARGINELHVEAGATLSGAMIEQGLVDELLIYMAPVLLGPGRPLAELSPLASMAQRIGLRFVESTPIGPDLRQRARIQGREPTDWL